MIPEPNTNLTFNLLIVKLFEGMAIRQNREFTNDSHVIHKLILDIQVESAFWLQLYDLQ